MQKVTRDADDYHRLYSTQWNQVGRSFVGDMGSTCNADGGWFKRANEKCLQELPSYHNMVFEEE